MMFLQGEALFFGGRGLCGREGKVGAEGYREKDPHILPLRDKRMCASLFVVVVG